MPELTLTNPRSRLSSPIPSVLPLAARSLVYEIGDARIINDVSCRIEARGCTAVLGYNGAGKSILLRLLHGLLVPSGGRVEWSAPASAQDIARRQSMVFQSPTLLRRSVEANIRYVLAKRGYRGSAARLRLEAVLEETELQHLRARSAAVLSGGERQRVALARALASEPDVVFLDEPTASLDPAAIVTIENILKRAMMAGRKLVLVTQSLGQAERLADDVIFLHRGQISEHTPIAEFLKKPRSAPARAFVEGRLFT